MNFLDILLEAKKGSTPSVSKTKTIKIKPDKDTEDYTDDVDSGSVDQSTDDVSDNTEDDTVDNGDDSTDYTQEESEVSPTDTPEDENADEQSTDYTSENTDETDDSGDGTDTSAEPDDNSTEEIPVDPVGDTEAEKNKIILTDFINLYNLINNSISKLSNVDKTNIFINKILTQVLSNLTIIKRHLYNFIVFKFSINKYVNNLYQYSFFTEAFKVNVEMLKKISVFIPNS